MPRAGIRSRPLGLALRAVLGVVSGVRREVAPMTTWLTRKLAAQCADYACTAPPLPDNCRCEKHRDEHRKRNSASAWRTRHGIRRRHVQLALEGVA
jgi:hypothetical protein